MFFFFDYSDLFGTSAAPAVVASTLFERPPTFTTPPHTATAATGVAPKVSCVATVLQPHQPTVAITAATGILPPRPGLMPVRGFPPSSAAAVSAVSAVSAVAVSAISAAASCGGAAGCAVRKGRAARCAAGCALPVVAAEEALARLARGGVAREALGARRRVKRLALRGACENHVAARLPGGVGAAAVRVIVGA